MHVALLVTEISRQDQNFRIIPHIGFPLIYINNFFSETILSIELKISYDIDLLYGKVLILMHILMEIFLKVDFSTTVEAWKVIILIYLI